MKKFILLSLLLASYSLSSFAQKQWTLEECINYALEQNISIKQLEIQKESSEVDLNTAKMSRLPNLSAGVGQSWDFGRAANDSGLYVNSLNTGGTSFSLSSSVPLFTGFRIPNEIARNKLELKAAIAGLEKAKEDLALNITSLYLQTLFNKELLKVSEDQLSLSKHQIIKTKALVDVGKVPVSQLYDMEAQVANDEVSVIQADNNLKLALLDLAQSLELQDVSEFDIVSPTVEDVITKYVSSVQPPSMIYNNALAIKPMIKEQEYLIQSAEKSLKIARSGYYPSLDLSLGYRTSYYHVYKEGFPNADFFDQIKNKQNKYIGLNLSIPIFNRFATRNQVKSAKLNIMNRELVLENTKKTLFKEIQTAYLNAASAQEKYRASGRAVKASKESFHYAQESYGVGKSSVFEFNEARSKYIKSRSEEIQAKYDYIFRTKILDFYNGVPIRL